jgi:hypothetical protein
MIVPILKTAASHEPQLCSAHCTGSVARAAHIDQSYRKWNAEQHT